MHNLAELQNDIAHAVLGGDFSQFSNQFSHSDRLPIFSNNTFSSLTEALKTVFPVTVRLSDARFFSYAAHEFIRRFPPIEPRLMVYGGRFPAFLRTFAACRSFPIIAEMATFEWAIASSLNQGIYETVPAKAFRNAASDPSPYLWLQPNVRFAVSHWPLVDIWKRHKDEKTEEFSQFSPRPTRIVVSRCDNGLQFHEQDVSRFAFWRSIAKGSSLEAAATKAISLDPLFDLVKEVLLLFRAGLVVKVSSVSPLGRERIEI